MNFVVRNIVLIAFVMLGVRVYAQQGVVAIRSDVKILAEAGYPEEEVRGYSIRIFSDNSQAARTRSQEIKSSFESKYSNVPIDVSYDAPYFKVTVGKFLTKEEAIMLWGNLQGEYSTAFVVPINIKIGEFSSGAIPQLATSSIEESTIE